MATTAPSASFERHREPSATSQESYETGTQSSPDEDEGRESEYEYDYVAGHGSPPDIEHWLNRDDERNYDDEEAYDDSEEGDYDSDEAEWRIGEDCLKPSDSISTLLMRDISRPPPRQAPPSVFSSLSAGGPAPGYYFDLLSDEGMNHYKRQIPFLEKAFSSDVSRQKSTASFVSACENLKRFGKERVDLALTESSQRAAMERILFAYLSPEWARGDGEVCYVVAQPEPWDRVPETVRAACDLSIPAGDIFIGINPANPPPLDNWGISGELPHPLSHEAIRRILCDKETQDFAPNKSTSSTYVYLHDLALIQYKAEGDWERYSRSEEMSIALAQTCNTAYFQLATMVELWKKVELSTDGRVAPRFFVLNMTICGEQWTVEYADRTMLADSDGVECTFQTLRAGDWVDNPSLFLCTLSEVLEQNLRLMKDKAARMEALLKKAQVSGQETIPKLISHSYSMSQKKAEVMAAAAKAKAAELDLEASAKRGAKQEDEDDLETIAGDTTGS